MISNVQVVYLFDVNVLSANVKSGKCVRDYVGTLKLCCLRLLTEFGGLCTNGNEAVRWGCRFYDSSCYRPDTSRRKFEDFNVNSFNIFSENLLSSHETHYKCLAKGNASKETSIPALNKTLQEALVDYDWDRPVICSPVKLMKHRGVQFPNKHTRSSRKNLGPKLPAELSHITIFTNIPKLYKASSNCKNAFPEKKHSPISDFLASIADESTRKEILDKNIQLHLVNVGQELVQTDEKNIINKALKVLNGCFHEIKHVSMIATNTVLSQSDPSRDYGSLLNIGAPVLGFVDEKWLKYSRNKISCGIKKTESTIVWEDEQGFSFLKIPIMIQKFQGKAEAKWDPIVVSGVIRTNSMSMLGLANTNSSICLCTSSEKETYSIVLNTLRAQNCVLILRHQFNGLMAFAPLAGDLGCIVCFSTSGLATPPISESIFHAANDPTNESLSSFVSSFIKKALMNAPAIEIQETGKPLQKFNNQMLKPWYPALIPSNKNTDFNVSSISQKRKQMMESLKKKYLPQIPCLLSGSRIPAPVFIDVTQPASAAGIPGLETRRSKSPTLPSLTLKQKPITRGQRLASRGLIVTAEIKAKEHRNELNEKNEANKRKIAVAEDRSRRSIILSAKILKNLDHQNRPELVQKLVALRNVEDEETLLTISQTIINVALTVLRSNCAPFLVESELRAMLLDSIFMTPAQICSHFLPEYRLKQLQLQVLLQLELLWNINNLFNSSVNSKEMCSIKTTESEYHSEEILRHLRAISLKYNPTLMATFLEQTVLPNFQESLGETLFNIYEELNQPLPESLSGYQSQEESSPVRSVISESIPSLKKPESSESGPSQKYKGAFRRSSSRIAIQSEVSNRQIVIPRQKPAIRRITSANEPKTNNTDLKVVRRNLFDLDTENPKPNLRRCKTVSDFTDINHNRTPKKRSREVAFSSPDRDTCARLACTPLKGQVNNITPTTPSCKRRRVYAHETPAKNVGKNIFNSQRLCKSTGSTVIAESPDTKGTFCASPSKELRSLTLTRRRSFYSGGMSRNFEKGRISLLASHIKPLSDNARHSFPQTADSSFLFSKILTEETQFDSQEQS